MISAHCMCRMHGTAIVAALLVPFPPVPKQGTQTFQGSSAGKPSIVLLAIVFVPFSEPAAAKRSVTYCVICMTTSTHVIMSLCEAVSYPFWCVAAIKESVAMIKGTR